MLPLSLVTARRYEVLKLIQHDKQGLVRRQPLIGVCGDTSMSEVSRKKIAVGRSSSTTQLETTKDILTFGLQLINMYNS